MLPAKVWNAAPLRTVSSSTRRAAAMVFSPSPRRIISTVLLGANCCRQSM
jgi:hypothetical protein